MTVVDKAPPAAPLELIDGNPTFFKTLDGETPVVVSVPGSSSFNLSLFNATAIGTVNPTVAGSLQLVLFGRSKDSDVLLPIASSVPESIGGADELEETMWMIRGLDLMIFTGSGRMQGLFYSNVANSPQPPVDIEHHPEGITDSDPLYIFGVGAKFTPTASRGAVSQAVAPCTVRLTSFTIDA